MATTTTNMKRAINIAIAPTTNTAIMVTTIMKSIPVLAVRKMTMAGTVNQKATDEVIQKMKANPRRVTRRTMIKTKPVALGKLYMAPIQMSK